MNSDARVSEPGHMQSQNLRIFCMLQWKMQTVYSSNGEHNTKNEINKMIRNAPKVVIAVQFKMPKV